MTSILCLAHYCDTHGPTPVMVTEGLSVGCTSCSDDLGSRRPSTSSRSLNAAESNSMMGERTRTASTMSDGASPGASSSAIETPPESPRVASLQIASRRDSSFRRTYDENDKKRASPCENCSLTLPKTTSGVPSRVENSGPILRTRKPFKKVPIVTENPSPPKSPSENSSNSSSDSETAVEDKRSHRHTQSRTLVRAGTSSSSSSFNSTASHDHFVDYTSTHEPLTSASFSIVRQSCLRTLSCETLPPSSASSTQTPTSPFLANNPFTSSSSPSGMSSNSTSGGPIFFGDPLAGYTTAFIFRIPDPSARGRRRVYALMAIFTHRERAAMQAFSFLTAAFRDLASWIQGLAEAELERGYESPRTGNGEPYLDSSRHPTPPSSFLSGRNRGHDGKFTGMSLKAKGLAEIVGLPDFFIELHARFVRLLVELKCLMHG